MPTTDNRSLSELTSIQSSQNFFGSVPSVYVACLASYNNGILHGKWIALDSSENISESIQAMLRNSPISNAEEWAIHDHEHCENLSEYAGIDTLEDIQEAFLKISDEEYDWELFCEFCNHMGNDLDSDSVEKFIENYAGSASSLEAWCDEFLESTGCLNSIPSHLRFYFDLHTYASDLRVNDVFSFWYDHKEHVFWKH